MKLILSRETRQRFGVALSGRYNAVVPQNSSAQNVALEIFPSDLAWHVQAARNRTENCFTNAQIGPPVQAWGGATGCFRGRGETEGGGKLQQLEKARPIDPNGLRPLIAHVIRG